MNAICCKGEKRDVRFTKRALESEKAADTSSCEASFSFLFFSSSLPHLHLFLGGKWVEVGQEFACLPACLPARLLSSIHEFDISKRTAADPRVLAETEQQESKKKKEEAPKGECRGRRFLSAFMSVSFQLSTEM